VIGEINELGFWFKGFRDLGISRCRSAPEGHWFPRGRFFINGKPCSATTSPFAAMAGALYFGVGCLQVWMTRRWKLKEKENRKMKNEKNKVREWRWKLKTKKCLFLFVFCDLTYGCNFKKKNYFILCCFRLRKQKKKRLSNEVLRKKHKVLSHVKKKP